MIVLALAVRRLPLRIARLLRRPAADLDIARRRRPRTSAPPRRDRAPPIVLPLMTGGILAGSSRASRGGLSSLSATLMLVQSSSDAPLAYGLYVFMQSPRGQRPRRGARRRRGGVVAACALLSKLVIERGHAAKGAGR
jgi:iron(III) transport system permease protein